LSGETVVCVGNWSGQGPLGFTVRFADGTERFCDCDEIDEREYEQTESNRSDTMTIEHTEEKLLSRDGVELTAGKHGRVVQHVDTKRRGLCSPRSVGDGLVRVQWNDGKYESVDPRQLVVIVV
jgi:hypothetical protein